MCLDRGGIEGMMYNAQVRLLCYDKDDDDVSVIR